METISQQYCFEGVQGVYRHASEATGTKMTFGLYVPPQAKDGMVPVLLYLSGLTCTHENVIAKAGAQRYCAEHGLAFLAPDTSPRGLDLPGEDEEYDFGSGAGFYIDATQSPWRENYRMYSYVATDLLQSVEKEFPSLDLASVGITGHSMGGHGALTIALKNPDRFKSVSAFAPICAPISSPWGEKALKRYLGPNRQDWRPYDACALIEDGARVGDILVDQGQADEFLAEQLKPKALEKACASAGISLTLRCHAGYDHSYYFISTFIAAHVAWAADRLN